MISHTLLSVSPFGDFYGFVQAARSTLKVTQPSFQNRLVYAMVMLVFHIRFSWALLCRGKGQGRLWHRAHPFPQEDLSGMVGPWSTPHTWLGTARRQVECMDWRPSRKTRESNRDPWHQHGLLLWPSKNGFRQLGYKSCVAKGCNQQVPLMGPDKRPFRSDDFNLQGTKQMHG